MSIIQKLVAAAVAAFAVCSNAREITSVKIVQESGIAKAKVSLTAGETGDNHVLYLAYGSRNCGETLHAWANGGGVMPCLEVADGATSVSVELSGDAAKAAYHKAFLVKKLETPAYNPGTYNIVEYIRQGSNGNAWFVTDYYCTGKESIAAVFEGIGNPEKSYRPFGFRCESSGVKQCVIDVYNNKSQGWGFTIIKDDSSWNWVNPAKLTASTGKTELTFDLFNLKYTRATAEDSVIHNILPEYTFFREGVEKSSVPLVIFGVNNNSSSGTSCIDGSTPNGGSLLYRCSIKTNDSAYARYYIPVTGPSTITTTPRPMGYLWEVVENKVISRTTLETHYNYQNSSFVPRDINDVNLPALDFHAVVPAELQAKYETVVSSRNADRQIKEVSVERRSVTVSLTPGVSSGNDILYIAWGDSDKGDTLAAWGDNVYCAGNVPDEETSLSIELPRGSYPNYFRAFLVESSIACDSFAEYLMVENNARSYVETDYFPTPFDKYVVSFALVENDSNQYVISGGNVQDASGDKSGTAIAIFVGSNSNKSYWRHYINGGSALSWDYKSDAVSALPVKTKKTELYYDSNNGDNACFRVSYQDGISAEFSGYTKQGATKTASTNPLMIFNRTDKVDQSNNAGAGSKFYSLAVSNVVGSATILARHYIPAVKGGVYGVWEATENKFFPGADGYAFATTGENGGAIASIPFPVAAIPEELKSRYLTVESSCFAYRKEAGLHITIR